ncbi:MAG: PrgI family protein [Candidatus Moranbacteria bacterium]|nr:PrgI family protein [Candidatus Moranbacteria bacterium]
MLRFPVPQYINVEDKIAGPLTWKQLYWMIAMVVILMLSWRALSLAPFIIVATFIITLFCSLAFYRPWGQPLLKMFWFALVFIFQPKKYIWKRFNSSSRTLENNEEKTVSNTSSKRETYTEKITNLRKYADILDNPRKENALSLTQEKKHAILNISFLKNKKKT